MSKFEPWIECARSVLPSRMKGKTIMWWITVNVLAMCWYVTIADKRLDGSIAAIYSAALLAFAGSKGHELYEQRKAAQLPGSKGEGDA